MKIVTGFGHAGVVFFFNKVGRNLSCLILVALSSCLIMPIGSSSILQNLAAWLGKPGCQLAKPVQGLEKREGNS